MPWMIFIAKFGVAAGFLNAYFASFSDDRIFNIEKRATAIGICNLGARAVTSLAPLINELPEPFPMVAFISILSIAFLINTTLNLPEKSKTTTK